jgi:hypothetical protein
MRRLGALVQGLLLGVLLAWALLNLTTVEMGARIFRYQGF